MKTEQERPQKVKATLNLTKEAQDTMLDNGYCSVRGMGEFISELIMDYHRRQTEKSTPGTLTYEIQQFIDGLDELRRTANKLKAIAR